MKQPLPTLKQHLALYPLQNTHITILLFFSHTHTPIAHSHTLGTISFVILVHVCLDACMYTYRMFCLTKNSQTELLLTFTGLVLGNTGVLSFIQLGHIHYSHFWAIFIKAVLLSCLQKCVVPAEKCGTSNSSFHVKVFLKTERLLVLTLKFLETKLRRTKCIRSSDEVEV